MSYRNFVPPGFATRSHDTGDWMTWMDEQGEILIPVAPHHPSSCEVCHGAVGRRYDGQPFRLCQHCQNYDDAVDVLIPMTYSVDAGLESMLHRYKDRGITWLGHPMGSLMYTFMLGHGDCVTRAAGGVDVATVVPSNNQERAFNQLDQLMHTIEDAPVATAYQWEFEVINRNFETTRPGRGELKPTAYVVEADEVDDASVLLLDDTWTSGSSTASAAAALKAAGARRVTVLTLGRQLNFGNNWGTSQEIYDDQNEAGWDSRECVVCA